MLERFRNNMFYIGVFMMSFTLFLEHLFIGETNITCFLKGFACGLELVGIIMLMKRKKNRE